VKVPRLRIMGAMSPFPTCLHGIALNYMIKYRDKFTSLINTRDICTLFAELIYGFLKILTVIRDYFSGQY
jgi:hypothetical protein